LTSLGAIFDQDSSTYTANIQYLISTLPIKKVCLFQSVACNFINQNFNAGLDKIGLLTEEVFASDYRDIVKKPVVSISQFDRKLELAEINLSRQMAFIHQAIKDLNSDTAPKHSLEGVIYGKGKRLSNKKIIRKIEDKDV